MLFAGLFPVKRAPSIVLFRPGTGEGERGRKFHEESGAKFAFARLCWVEYPACSLNSIDSVFGVRARQVFQGTGKQNLQNYLARKILYLSSSWFYYCYYPLDLHFSSLLLVFLYLCFSCFVEGWKSISKYFFVRISYIRYIQFWVEIDTEASFAHFRNERDIVKWRKFNAWCSLVADYELRGSIDNGWKGWKRMGNEQVLTILIILAISMRP